MLRMAEMTWVLRWSRWDISQAPRVYLEVRDDDGDEDDGDGDDGDDGDLYIIWAVCLSPTKKLTPSLICSATVAGKIYI